jgi:hypothetical protein
VLRQVVRLIREGGEVTVVPINPDDLDDEYPYDERWPGVARWTDVGVNGDPRWEVTVNGDRRQVLESTLWGLALPGEEPRIFQRGGRLHRVLRDLENSRMQLEELSQPRLMAEAINRIRFVRQLAKTDKAGRHLLQEVEPPPWLLKALQGAGEWWVVPILDGLVRTPVLREDGTLLLDEGYDKPTRLYYDPGDLVLPTMMVEPSRVECELSASSLMGKDLLGDFPFASASDRAAALALLLTPLVRHLVPIAPIAVVDAPKAGTGKGLLVSCAAIITTGAPAQVRSMPATDEEMGKVLTAEMAAGSTFIFFDEASRLRSPKLASAITAELYTDRLLGQSSLVTVPQRVTWVCAGNNVQLVGDLNRRAYRIRMNAPVARPWERTDFRHPDLVQWVHRNRGGLLAGLLTMCRGWFAAGCPAPSVELGGFTEWSRIVGGILEFAGVEGFLGQQRALWGEDEEEREWSTFLLLLHDRFGERAWLVKDLIAVLESTPTLVEALPGDLPDKFARTFGGGGFSRALAHALRGKLLTRFEELHLEQAGTDRNGVMRWRVVPEDVNT